MIHNTFTRPILHKTLTSIGLASLSLSAPLAEAQVPGLVFSSADSSNTRLGDMFVGTGTLGNSVIRGNTPLTSGVNKFRFGAILFTATESGSFSFGQSQAPIDTIMMLFSGVFDASNVGVGKLTGNDDASLTNHRSILGSTATVACGANSARCPLINYNVVAGNTYTLLVSHYSSSTYSSFQFPFTFYGTGNPVFYEYGSLQPITKAQPFFLASQLGITVEPLFIGGTLLMDQGNTTYNNDFRLSSSESSTFDLNQNSIILNGLLKNNNEAQPGIIRFANGSATLNHNNTYSGKTIIEEDAILIISDDVQLGTAPAQLLLEGGTLSVTDNIQSDRIIKTQDYIDAPLHNNRGGTIQVAAEKTLELSHLTHNDNQLIKTGEGTLRLTNTGASNITGDILVQQGTLESVGTDALGTTASIHTAPTGTLSIKADSQHFNSIDNEGSVQIASTNNRNPSLNIQQNYAQTSTGRLSIDLSENNASTPIISADAVHLDGNLHLEYFDGDFSAVPIANSSSQIDSQPSIQHTLFESNQVITGDFTHVELDGTTVGPGGLEIAGLTNHDYIQFAWRVGKDSTEKKYQVYGQQNLRWVANDNTYEGQFTIQENDTFTLDSLALTDQTGSFNAWDGKSLTKKGAGTLQVSSAQQYTGNTTVEQGTLAWGLFDSTTPSQEFTQTLEGNYHTAAGATTFLSAATSYLEVKGNFSMAGDQCNGSVPGCFDPSNPLNTQGNSSDRAELKIVPGLSTRPEILVGGTVDIRGAYLNVQGIRAQNPNEVFRTSDLQTPGKSEYVILHAQEGFLGSDVWGGTNTSAGFANDQAALGGLDYLNGYASIVNCDPSAPLNPCLYSDGREGSKTQEYILSALELSWTYGGTAGLNNPLTRVKNGNFTIQEGSDFEVDLVLADQDQGTDVAPDGSGRLGFHSNFGWWDGKTLTKKGTGTLYLTNNNTYTGSTAIEQGTLSIADESHVGSTSAIYLGQKDADGAAILAFESSPSGSIGNLLGLNSGNTLTFSKDILLAYRNDNTIQVSNSSDTVTLTGNLQGNSTLAREDTAMSGTSWIKAGQGTLVVDPGAGKNIDFEGDTWVKEGTLVLKGNLSNIDGDIYNQGVLVFDNNVNTTINGLVSQNAPSPSSSTSGTSVGQTLKTGTGTLTLAGNSDTDWTVQSGTLAVVNKNFTSDVTLQSGSNLLFDSVVDPVNTDASYAGLITSAVDTAVVIDRLNQTLHFTFEDQSSIGLLDIQAGRLELQRAGSAASRAVNNRIQVNQLHVRGNGELALYGASTSMDVTQSVQFLDNSSLEITLDPSATNISKISAQQIDIGNNVRLNILGFSMGSNLGSLTAEGANAQTIINSLAKSSQLGSLDFLVLASKQAITGEFVNQPTAVFVNNPAYLVYQNRKEFNTDPSSTHAFEYRLGDFQLAWTANSTDFSTGTFDLVTNTGFNVDNALTNQVVPVGGFDSGWDGQSLLKTGEGLLVLSHSGNSYTGETRIQNGELALAADNTLQNSSGVFMEGDAILTIVDNQQTIQQLQSSSTESFIDLLADGVLTINNAHASQESHFAGSIVGGDGTSAHQSGLVLTNGLLHLTGTSSIDTVSLENDTHLTLDGDKAKLVARAFTLNQAMLSVDDKAMLQGIINDTADDSTVHIGTDSVWAMLDNSHVGTIDLQAGAIVFGDLAGKGNAGRTLHVDHWKSNEGKLLLATDVDSSQTPRLDTLVVHESGTGITDVEIIDKGGFVPLRQSRPKILPIESANGVGVLPTNSFRGGLTSGGLYYQLVYDNETGGFMIDTSVSGKTPEYQTDESALEAIAQGSAIHAIGKLSALNANPSNVCEVSQAFGDTMGSYGSANSNGGRSLDISHASLKVGSDVLAQSFDSGCVRYGVLGGYTKSTVDVSGSDPTKNYAFTNLGKVSADSYYAGGYMRYDHNDEWYINTAFVGFIEDLNNQTHLTGSKKLDGQTIAASVEFGIPFALTEQSSISPSAQIIYQSSSLDDTKNLNGQAMHFDRINGSFMRIGADYRYAIDNEVSLEIGAHAWHQFSTKTAIHTSIGESIHSQVGNRTWADLTVGVAAELNDQWRLHFDMGYRGDFSDQNAITGKLSVQYRF